MQIAGRSILVTGASSGIGAATARVIAREGGKPILFARTREKLDEVVADIESKGGSAKAYAVDCSDAAAVASTAEQVQAELGTPDAIVNNAGAGRFEFFDKTPAEEFEGFVSAPFFASLYVTRAFLPAMVERNSGIVLNVNTPAAYFPWPGSTLYASTRWALRGFTESLRQDLRGTGLKVCQVVPGAVSSPYLTNNATSEDGFPKVSKLVRVVSPEEVAEAIVTTLEREKRLVFIPLMLRAFMIQGRVLPRLTEELVGRTGTRRPPA